MLSPLVWPFMRIPSTSGGDQAHGKHAGGHGGGQGPGRKSTLRRLISPWAVVGSATGGVPHVVFR